MPPANLTATVSFNSANPAECHFDPGGPFELVQGQSLVISLSGFPTGSTMSSLALKSRENPTTEMFLFPPQQGTSNTADFLVSTDPSTSPLPAVDLVITITDNDCPETDQVFDLTLDGTLGGSDVLWHSDPEVINKAGG